MPTATPVVHGSTVRLTAAEHERALRGLASGHTVLVEPEQDNPRDRHAALVTSAGVPLGWVPQVLAPALRQLRERGPLALTVRRVGEPESPPHLRLDVALDVAAPDGLSFDHEGRWEPLVAP